MPKTLPPGAITIPGVDTFVADAVPDPFDERDLEYRPRLEPLPPVLDQRDAAGERFVMLQKGNSCTGHALAAVVNTVLARSTPTSGDAPRVSPYMLYRLARRYDEFQGEEDEGSSLRGAFKGWFHHGVALLADWPGLEMNPEPDLEDPSFIEKTRDRPLGAFYRVNPFRLDDMQSAISELNAIAVSSVVHDGWIKPVAMTRGDETIYVIRRSINSRSLGGHAYSLVGYNEVGFLVQNSWGPAWGKGGFATLPYEDFLDCAYDAWVARPGVPRTPFASGRTRTATATGGDLATAPGPDLRRLAAHVVNLGNEGLLSASGRFVSTPSQIHRIFEHMEAWHRYWLDRGLTNRRHIVLYAHGGLVDEAGGLQTAQKHLNWWLNNCIYPVNFAWQSGPAETLLDQLVDSTKGRLPVGGIGFDFVEQFDRLVERLARSNIRWMWDEMKENARAASAKIENQASVQWPPTSSPAQQAMAAMPGASLTVLRLAGYVQQNGPENVVVHLVGHSAGSIFHAALLQRLIDAGIKVDSMALLAPAIRVDEFGRDILPYLGAGKPVGRFVTFAMTGQRELDDVCGASGVNVYQKSLLYLVSRALERPARGQAGEVPLLGMYKFFDLDLDAGRTLRQAVTGAGGAPIFSRSAAPDDSRSDSASHGGFDDDSPTMTSVLMRALGVATAAPEYDYQANAPLRYVDGAPSAGRPPRGGMAQPAPVPPVEGSESLRAAAPTPLTLAVEANEPGETPVLETAQPQVEQPEPPPQPQDLVLEVAVAPRSGSPIVDVLEASGWTLQEAEA